MTYLIPEAERQELISPDGETTQTPETPEDHVNLRNSGWRTKEEHDLAAQSDAEVAATVHTPGDTAAKDNPDAATAPQVSGTPVAQAPRPTARPKPSSTGGEA